jgi:hypothetical protein
MFCIFLILDTLIGLWVREAGRTHNNVTLVPYHIKPYSLFMYFFSFWGYLFFSALYRPSVISQYHPPLFFSLCLHKNKCNVSFTSVAPSSHERQWRRHLTACMWGTNKVWRFMLNIFLPSYESRGVQLSNATAIGQSWLVVLGTRVGASTLLRLLSQCCKLFSELTCQLLLFVPRVSLHPRHWSCSCGSRTWYHFALPVLWVSNQRHQLGAARTGNTGGSTPVTWRRWLIDDQPCGPDFGCG